MVGRGKGGWGGCVQGTMEGDLLEQAPEGVVGAPLNVGLVDGLHGRKLGGQVAIWLEHVVESVGSVAYTVHRVQAALKWRSKGRW